MRTLLKIQIPTPRGNTTLQDGSLPKTLLSVLGELRPEAAYFTVGDGLRTGYVVFDLKDSSDIPVLLEPLFQGLDAKLDLTPVMNQTDLEAGLGRVSI